MLAFFISLFLSKYSINLKLKVVELFAKIIIFNNLHYVLIIHYYKFEKLNSIQEKLSCILCKKLLR